VSNKPRALRAFVMMIRGNMKAFAVTIFLTLGMASGASGESLSGCVHREHGCSWLEVEGASPPVSLEGQFQLPSCPVAWAFTVEGRDVRKPAHSPYVCSVTDFSRHFHVTSLSCEKPHQQGGCKIRVTLKRWIIDNQRYLKNCAGKKRKDDPYDFRCDGNHADVLDEKLQDLILKDDTPLVRRFDDDKNRYHIICMRNERVPHCHFTSNMVHL
jgi:hypothetical protein